MCLDYDYKKDSKTYQKVLKQAKKRGYIRVYKLCRYKKSGWCSLYCKKYKSGLQKAKNTERFDGGFYGYLTKSAAMRSHDNWWGSNKIKVCYAKPSWLKRFGVTNDEGWTGIFTHLVFPDWDKGDMTIREFKRICKENKRG